MAPLVLLVNAFQTALRQTERLLTDAGYLVADVSSFGAAKNLLHSVSPDLLITEIRLAEFNGLRLAAWARLHNPSLPIIITDASPDPVLKGEAERLGATFVVNPLANPNFLGLVKAALEEYHRAGAMIRRWPRKGVNGSVKVDAASVQAQVVDLSYGGMRLAFRNMRDDVPTEFDITLPTAGITLKAYRVWTSRSLTTEDYWCGAELADTGSGATNQWREFVDSLALGQPPEITAR
jgi:DNA-binding response OmpR family regulator